MELNLERLSPLTLAMILVNVDNDDEDDKEADAIFDDVDAALRVHTGENEVLYDYWLDLARIALAQADVVLRMWLADDEKMEAVLREIGYG